MEQEKLEGFFTGKLSEGYVSQYFPSMDELQKAVDRGDMDTYYGDVFQGSLVLTHHLEFHSTKLVKASES